MTSQSCHEAQEKHAPAHMYNVHRYIAVSARHIESANYYPENIVKWVLTSSMAEWLAPAQPTQKAQYFIGI